jgi:hypothetical protein
MKKTKKTPESKPPFPFSVGFPLSIRESERTLSICGANHGFGHPILCEVPKGEHAKSDAAAIAAACTEKVDRFISPSAAAPWSKERPTRPGLYLVQFLCDAFPKGDPNNVCHQLVNIVHDGRVLHDGRFRDEADLKGWIWARVSPAKDFSK